MKLQSFFLKAFYSAISERKKVLAILFLSLFILFTANAIAQTGIYGWTGKITSSKLHQYKLNGYKGVRILLPWFKLQPTEGDLSFSNLKTTIKEVSDSGLNMELQVWVGNNAPISGKNTWLRDKGVETFNTTGHKLTGPWPDYYNPVYMQAFNMLHKSLSDMLYHLPQDQKAHVKSVFISNGSTGDAQPVKGTPPPTYSYFSNNKKWNAYVKVQWDSCAAYYAKCSTFLRLSFNPSIEAQDLAYLYKRYPGAYLKRWDASNRYPVNGEIFQANWPPALYFGEVDDAIKLSTNKSDQFQLIRSALSLKTSRLDFMDPWLNLDYVPTFVKFFDKYSNQFNTVTANKGFCALAEKINFLNTDEYPENVYGSVQESEKNYKRRTSTLSDNNDDTLHSQMRFVGLASRKLNKIRLENLKKTGAGFEPNGPFYNNDIGWYVKNNYSLNITQLKIAATSTGLYRIDEGSIYGRNARKPRESGGFTALYFDVDDRLIKTPENDKVIFTVTYKDLGTATWELQCYGGFKKSVTNTNSGKWMQVSFTVDHFKRGNLMRNGADLILDVTNGDPFPVDMVEFERSN